MPSVASALTLLLLPWALPCCDGGSTPSDAGSPDGEGVLDGDSWRPPPACPAREWAEPPPCGSEDGSWESLIPGPWEPNHEAALTARARRFDRQFHTFHVIGTGASTEVEVPPEWEDERAAIEAFLTESDRWDFEAHSGLTPESVVASWGKVAGAYAGVGAAAEAFRYAVLRDSGADCDEVERARAHLVAAAEALHLAVAITGAPGVIARGFARIDLDRHGASIETVPLFDEEGNPLPEEKNNGTWREDNSGGAYPGYAWEDSCSRDMLVGWVVGFAAVWEVIELDPSFPEELREELRADATAIARSLMREGERGFDLEIRDADGRVTYHGYLHEEAIDRLYLPPSKNGINALMALGIVAALAFIADDDEVDDYLYNALIRERRLHELSRDEMYLLDMGTRANFSGHNMLFDGGWLASRYLCDDDARRVVRQALDEEVYNRSPMVWPVAEQGQTLYDFVYAAAVGGATCWTGLDASTDADAAERGIETLRQFPDAPFWDVAVENCDAAEIDALSCQAVDGSTLELLGHVGRRDALVASEPLPMSIRPPSNYFWRSSPYQPNGGGDGSRLLPAVDLRFVYWMGRYLRWE